MLVGEAGEKTGRETDIITLEDRDLSGEAAAQHGEPVAQCLP